MRCGAKTEVSLVLVAVKVLLLKIPYYAFEILIFG